MLNNVSLRRAFNAFNCIGIVVNCSIAEKIPVEKHFLGQKKYAQRKNKVHI